jgi:hypothetical protein
MAPHRIIALTLAACAACAAAPAADASATAPAAAPAQATPIPADVLAAGGDLAPTRRRLLEEFANHLRDGAAYDRLVSRKCGQFPEGALYPFALPALAYANLGLASGKDATRAWARDQVRALIDLALPRIARQVGPPNGDLAQLADFQQQGTFLSMAGCMLGCWRLLGGDDRYARQETAIDAALARALIAADGATIASYPAYSWTFDTVPALLALRLHERATPGAPAQALPLLAKHLVWLDAHATDPQSHLPYSQQEHPGEGGEPPRGCDLSMRVCLLAELDPAAAKTLYGRYVGQFWRDTGAAAGFREWPPGHPDGTDVDSGPILDGIGMTATGVGIGACLALDDHARVARLAGELALVDHLRALTALADPHMAQQALGTAAADPAYVTGFLYGDATLFYAVTWSDWHLDANPRP